MKDFRRPIGPLDQQAQLRSLKIKLIVAQIIGGLLAIVLALSALAYFTGDDLFPIEIDRQTALIAMVIAGLGTVAESLVTFLLRLRIRRLEASDEA
ncbi:hypothetical protein WM2015_76 [Wenzhouxiangella marina]|uniref:Uncharacterized protein n=2 Tax=Wenzhouxiangella marina TaxID=1579979 RepID=A0A0K0XS68_9GAMM|nr:hypothetical protein WM2015_76 [Wenzhouxiangella marina]